MDKEFVYNPSNPCIVLRNGEDIGALVAGRLYRFDSHSEEYVLIDNLLFQYGKKIGRLEGRTVICELTNEVFELIEC